MPRIKPETEAIPDPKARLEPETTIQTQTLVAVLARREAVVTMNDYIELRWQDPRTRTYLGSPSLVRLAGGDLLATHDYFGAGCPRNHENEEHLTSVYRSEDDGRSWRNVTHIANAYWSTLFVHRGSVYLLGCSQQYGSVVIRRSDDAGLTWTHPADEKTGLLFQGGWYHEPPNYHCGPMPILAAGGRLYRAVEDCDPCVWGGGFRSCVISADEDADLLQAASWTMSNKLVFDPAWVPQSWGPLVNPGWLEGNCVLSPNGEIWNILRMNSEPLADKAAIVKVQPGGERVSFGPADGFIDLPGGMTKFTIRRDPASGLYVTLSNPAAGSTGSRGRDLHLPAGAPADVRKLFEPIHGSAYQRNVLALCTSRDLRQWTVDRILLTDDSPLTAEASRRLTGFQYVDWQFDGADILYLVRTAYDGANNCHDSNRITFHRLAAWRER